MKIYSDGGVQKTLIFVFEVLVIMQPPTKHTFEIGIFQRFSSFCHFRVHRPPRLIMITSINLIEELFAWINFPRNCFHLQTSETIFHSSKIFHNVVNKGGGKYLIYFIKKNLCNVSIDCLMYPGTRNSGIGPEMG